MIEIIRRLKLAYSVYNFFHRKELHHNEALYKKLGIRKKYYSPVSSKDFENLSAEVSHVSVDETKLKQTKLFKSVDSENQKSLLEFNDKGFSILKNYLSSETVYKINLNIENLLKDKKVKFGYGGKIMFAIHVSELLNSIGNNETLHELLSVLLNGNSVLFQSINFIKGSEQDTHSDSIHMTTYPLGGLLGVWIALEDVDDENGPLHYYPGSHKLPYYLNKDYKNEGNSFLIGNKSYSEYEKMIGKKIEELGLKKEIFKAKKGDLLIWHANLFHGGEKHKNPETTRKSMVLHYFKENCICYHEITQRPALIKDFD
ncbi:phytanoyl-CoA dioxygenase family protein [Aurantibacillus circumpalustris]|uniref:phytanoyl-CoA dioxygenase family protein n=1 Tax=Aurantibacillus circumpalustris TaxID=3036359 RepID=UPI00295AF14B|nr:phytanoyl-CoA dioxygenase family protein [Aurantibacillus circumpalustris]